MKQLLLGILLLLSVSTQSATPPNHPVQPYVNYPQMGFYVLKNHHLSMPFQCWVQFPDGYTIQFVMYPLVVSSPFPMYTNFGCY